MFLQLSSNDISLQAYLICIAISLVCGVITAFSASFQNKATHSFTLSLVLLPVIVATVIIMVNGSIGTGIAVAGAFSLVRFRSAPGNARDIMLIFLSMTSGLTCAAGYIGIALLFNVFSSFILFLFSKVMYSKQETLDLHITIPENLNSMNCFDDIFARYCTNQKLFSIKTSNMGSLYKLKYHITMKTQTELQSFIDDLRCRNGNLEILVCHNEEGSDTL